MILSHPLEGKNIILRSIEETDAEFILQIRLDPRLSQFIGQTDPSIDKQRQWIAGSREAQDDYTMLIQSVDSKSFGTIAIYDINKEQKRAEWGRWVIDPDAPFYVAFESAILMYHFAFYTLDLSELYFGVQAPNKKVINFHKNFGAEVTSENDKETWFAFNRDLLKPVLDKYSSFHNLNIGE